MPSVLSHPAIPMGLTLAFGTRVIPTRLATLGIICAVLPDIDAIGYKFGIPYGHLLGHRGLSHSILFAVALAAIAAMLHRQLQAPWTIAFLFVAVSTASHGVLDAMTTGGLGVAFLSPVSNHRFFLPWRVIAVSPIGITRFFSQWGLRVLRSEVLWVWLPCIFVAIIGITTRRKSPA